MPNQYFEVASPFEDAEAFEPAAVTPEGEAHDAQSVEINARRAAAEHAENLRLARAL